MDRPEATALAPSQPLELLVGVAEVAALLTLLRRQTCLLINNHMLSLMTFNTLQVGFSKPNWQQQPKYSRATIQKMTRRIIISISA